MLQAMWWLDLRHFNSQHMQAVSRQSRHKTELFLREWSMRTEVKTNAGILCINALKKNPNNNIFFILLKSKKDNFSKM